MFRPLFFCSLTAVLLWSTAAPAVTQSEMCASAGAYSESVVRSRDRGIPPTQHMTRLDTSARMQRDPDRQDAITFMRWVVLYVYEYPSLDAAWLRQRVETKCLRELP